MNKDSKETMRHPALDAGSKKVKIKEIFASIQGEGPYVGYKQLFIRFCGCNLKCNYCDTDFSAESDCMEFSATELAQEVNKYTDVHSISLTGGEPLLSVEFLKEFLPLVGGSPLLQHFSVGEGAVVGEEQTSRTTAGEVMKKDYNYKNSPSPQPSPVGRGGRPKIYLETNATLPKNFLQIKPYVDIVSADIKLESATGLNTFELHDKFFEACRGVETFAKIVFNQNITDEEIKKCCELGQKYGIELILQPETLNSGKSKVESGKLNDFQLSTFNFQLGTVLDKFLQNYPNVRLIPQVHKFLNVR